MWIFVRNRNDHCSLPRHRGSRSLGPYWLGGVPFLYIIVSARPHFHLQLTRFTGELVNMVLSGGRVQEVQL